MSESASYVVSACRENDVKFGRLWSPQTARDVQKAMEYFPQPPYAE
jgi:hypothetical protein